MVLVVQSISGMLKSPPIHVGLYLYFLQIAFYGFNKFVVCFLLLFGEQ